MAKRILCLALLCCAGALSITWFARTPSRAADAAKVDFDKQITALMEQRRDTLKQRLEYATARARLDPKHFDDQILANDEFLQAKLALATSREDRIAIAKERVENFREREDYLAAQSKAGLGGPDIELVARAARQQAEIELLREQRGSESKP